MQKIVSYAARSVRQARGAAVCCYYDERARVIRAATLCYVLLLRDADITRRFSPRFCRHDAARFTRERRDATLYHASAMRERRADSVMRREQAGGARLLLHYYAERDDDYVVD